MKYKNIKFIEMTFFFIIISIISSYSMEVINYEENTNFPDFLYPSESLINSNDKEYFDSIESLLGTSEKRGARYKTIIDDLVIKFSSLTALKQQSAIQEILLQALKRIDNTDFSDISILKKDMNDLTGIIYNIVGFNPIKFEIDLNNIYKTRLDIDYFNQQEEFLENMDSKKLGCFRKRLNKGINDDTIPTSKSTHQNYILHSKAFGSHYPCLEIIDTIRNDNDYEFTQIYLPKLISKFGYQIICYFMYDPMNDMKHVIWFEGYNPTIQLNKNVNIFNRTDEIIIQSCQKTYFNLIESQIAKTTYIPPRIANKMKNIPVPVKDIPVSIKEKSTNPRKQIRRTSLSAPTNSNPNIPLNDKNSSKTNNLPPISLDNIEYSPSTPSARKPDPSSAPDRMLRRNLTADNK